MLDYRYVGTCESNRVPPSFNEGDAFLIYIIAFERCVTFSVPEFIEHVRHQSTRPIATPKTSIQKSKLKTPRKYVELLEGQLPRWISLVFRL